MLRAEFVMESEPLVPKLVDHEARRAEIVDTTLRIVARDGLAGATTRALAKELGVANGAVGHYFKNQDVLLAATYEEVFARTNARAGRAVDGRRGLDALLAKLREMLPMDSVTLDEARIVVCFWGRVTTDTRLRARLPEEHHAWTHQVRDLLVQAIDDGDLRTATDPMKLAELLVTTVHAMQVRAVTLPEETPTSVQQELVEQILTPWMRRPVALSSRWLASTERSKP